MTTIAYRDGVLAGDTMITSGSQRAGYRVKIARLGVLLYAATGPSGLCNGWERWLFNGMTGQMPTMGEADRTAAAFVFMPDDRIVWFHHEGVETLFAPFWASGSGGAFAAGAMSQGATAPEAVAVAMKHDVYTGGEITIIRRAA